MMFINWRKGASCSGVAGTGPIGSMGWERVLAREPGKGGQAHLRGVYRVCLISFRGTHYLWGGETHIGIDCSELARTAFCDAM